MHQWGNFFWFIDHCIAMNLERFPIIQEAVTACNLSNVPSKELLEYYFSSKQRRFSYKS
jgi:hypothetical protein